MHSARIFGRGVRSVRPKIGQLHDLNATLSARTANHRPQSRRRSAANQTVGSGVGQWPPLGSERGSWSTPVFSSLTYEDAKRALLDPKLTWAAVRCLACMVLGGQAFDGFCLGRNRNVRVEALGSTWLLYALPAGTPDPQHQARLDLMLQRPPPAEVPQ